jgi:hypothetical protein
MYGQGYTYGQPFSNSGASQQGAFGQPTSGSGFTSPGHQGGQQSDSKPSRAELFTQATHYFRAKPEYRYFLSVNQQNVDFLIQSYLHLTQGTPPPYGFTPCNPSSQGSHTPPQNHTPPHYDDPFGFGEFFSGQGGNSTPPDPPRPPNYGPQGPRRGGRRQDNGSEGGMDGDRDSEEFISRGFTKRKLFTERKRLLSELWEWFRSWFTKATGTQEFVDDKMRSARQTLKPAMSYFDKFNKKRKEIWETLQNYEETSSLIVTPTEFFCTYWKHMLCIFTFVCFMVYIVSWMQSFPENLYAVKMVILVLQCCILQWLKFKPHQVLLIGLFTTAICVMDPNDSYHELSDEKLEPARVYRAMDMCMKAKSNKFVLEGYALLEQVIDNCLGNRDGNKCRHLVNVALKQVNNFKGCLLNVARDSNLVEQSSIQVPIYSKNDGSIVYKKAQFSEVKKSFKLSMYAVLIRMETGQYFIVNDKLSYFQNQLAQTGEKALQYWRFLPLFFPGLGSFVAALDLAIDSLGYTNGPLTRRTILAHLDSITPSISEKEKMGIQTLMSKKVSGVNDIFYEPPPTRSNINAIKLITAQQSSFWVKKKEMKFFKFSERSMQEDYYHVTPNCTSENVLRNLLWNMDSACPLGDYCREAMEAQITEHDTSLCPVKCTKTAFGSGCQTHIDMLTDTTEKFENCTNELAAANEKIQELLEQADNDEKCSEEDEPFKDHHTKSDTDYEETFHEDKEQNSRQGKFQTPFNEYESFQEKIKNSYKKFSKEHYENKKEKRAKSESHESGSDEPDSAFSESYQESHKKSQRKWSYIGQIFSIIGYFFPGFKKVQEFSSVLFPGAALFVTIFCCILCLERKKNDNPATNKVQSRFSLGGARQSPAAKPRVIQTKSPLQSTESKGAWVNFDVETSSISSLFSWVTTPEVQTELAKKKTDTSNIDSVRRVKDWQARNQGGGTVRLSVRRSERIAAQQAEPTWSLFGNAFS